MKVRGGKISPDDFAGTTCSITNPGHDRHGALGAAADARPGLHRRRRHHRLPRRVRGCRPRRTGAARGEQGHHAHQHLRPPHHHRRRERRVPPAHPRAAARRRTTSTTTCSPAWRCRTSRRAGTRTAAGSPIRPPSTRRSCRSTPSSTCTACAGTSSPTSTRSVGASPTRTPSSTSRTTTSRSGTSTASSRSATSVSGRLPRKMMPLRDILGVLRDAYARTVGVEYMHIQEPDQKEWIQERVEGPHAAGHRRRRSTGSSSGSTRPRRSSASCTRSTWGRSASASKARRRSSRCSTRSARAQPTRA